MFVVGNLLLFIIVLSSSSIIKNVHRPSRVALLYFIGCLWNDMYVFESFLSLHHLLANLVKNVDERGRNIVRAHYRADFFLSVSFLRSFLLSCNSISLIRGLNYFC